MEEVFREAQRLIQAGEPFVLATVARTHGSTPQKPGAKLLVRRDGGIVGTLGGGCIEGEVWYRAKEALREGSGVQFGEFVLADELAAESGMVCGGTMEVLIDPVFAGEAVSAGVEGALEAFAGATSLAWITEVRPASGAKMFLWPDGRKAGTLGDAVLDEEAAAIARQMWAHGGVRLATLSGGAEVLVEAFAAPPTLLVAGGGHIGKALSTMAKFLGLRVVIVDDRPDFANRDRFPEADEVLAMDFVTALRQLPINANTYVVVATRGHKYDDLALLEAARSPAGYVGLVGSKRKTLLIYRELLRQGIPLERLREVHAPIGLNIGARTPEEIALSILAEITMVRLGGDGQPMKLDEHLLSKARDKAGATLR